MREYETVEIKLLKKVKREREMSRCVVEENKRVRIDGKAK